MQENAENCTKNKEVVQEFEEIIKNRKSDIVWLAY